jgi:8-oxo-dGTP pyrophosphatase MutT (NUDIX family)
MTVEKSAVPRPSATVLLLRDDPFEVLMVRRNEKMHFAAALVFPGGLVDAADHAADWLPHLEGAHGLDAQERAFRIAALRETFEETGVLVTRSGGARADGPDAAGGGDFLNIIRDRGLRLDLSEVHPFAHWITPARVPKRFDTRFFLCRAPDGAEAVCDGDETVALEWVQPTEILARAYAGERSILFPTRMNLKRLAESDSSTAAIEAAAKRPRVAVMPEVGQRDGKSCVFITPEAGYGDEDEYSFPAR